MMFEKEEIECRGRISANILSFFTLALFTTNMERKLHKNMKK